MTTTGEIPRRPHGRMVNCTGGYRAYVPGPLPPPLGWTPELALTLSDADRAVGRLASEGRRLPNPHIVIRPFVRREAVLSSRIEGTQATLGELLAVQAGAAVERSPAELREVGNYVTALEYGIDRLTTLPLSLRLVREMHERLMRGVRSDAATPGEFRRSQNWIGPAGCILNEATYVPPPPSELMRCLGEWERFLHDESLPPLTHAALTHAQFEAIHPFLDGNGRVGRLLISLILVSRDIIPAPLLDLSAYFERTRDEYYSKLLAVTERGQWEEWLVYFLKGVAMQAEDVVSRIQRMDDLLSPWRRDLSLGRSPIHHMALDLFAENPYWSVGGLSERLEVAFSTAKRAMDRLESLGVVSIVGEARRNRIYCARDILEVLEDDNPSPRRRPPSSQENPGNRC